MYSSRDVNKTKMFNVLLKRPFFLEIANYPSFLKHGLLKKKMPGSSTAADNPFDSSICPKRQARKVHLTYLYLYYNAAIIQLSHH